MKYGIVGLLILTQLVLTQLGCTWVKPIAGADHVALVKPAHVSNCGSLGEAVVTVKDRVGFIERRNNKVADELLTLARNQAVAMGGDTLVSKSAEENGSQRFDVYRCNTGL